MIDRYAKLIVMFSLATRFISAGSACAEDMQAINLSPGYTSDSAFPATEAVLAVHDRQITVLYRRGPILFQTMSNDSGATFSVPQRFMHSAVWYGHRNERPHIAWDNKDKLHMVWSLHDDKSSPRYTCSADHGRTWTEPLQVGGGHLPRGTGPAFAISLDGSVLQTLAFDWGNAEVFSARSDDAGKTWTAYSTGHAAPRRSFASSAVLTRDHAFYALTRWDDSLRVVNPGEDWRHTELVPKGVPVSLAHAQALGITPEDTLFAVYAKEGNVVFQRTEPNVGPWKAPVIVAADVGENARPVVGRGANGRFHIAWENARTGRPQIYHAVSDGEGEQWRQHPVLPASTPQRQPMLVMEKDIPHLLWIEHGSPYYVRLSDSIPDSVRRQPLAGKEIRRFQSLSDQHYVVTGSYTAVNPIHLTGEWYNPGKESTGSFALALPETQERETPFVLECRAPSTDGDLTVVVRVEGPENTFDVLDVSMLPGTLENYREQFSLKIDPDKPFFPIFGWLIPDAGILDWERERVMAAAPNMTEDRVLAEYAMANFTLGTAGTARFGTRYWAGVPKEDAAIVALTQDPRFWGFQGPDEPSEEAFAQLAETNRRIRQLAPDAIYWVNHYPTYVFQPKDDAEQNMLAPYEQFIHSYIQQVKPSFFTYDHYPLCGGNWRGPYQAGDWFANLEIVRSQAAKADCDFGVIAGVAAFGGVRGADEGELRWQAFSALAYGAKAIGWFTYRTELPYGGMNWRDAIINRDGSRTRHYSMIRQVNAEILAWSPTLLRLKSTGVYHTDPLPLRTRAVKTSTLLHDITGGICVAGEFSDANGTPWLMIVNRDYQQSVHLTLNFRREFETIERLSRKTGKLAPLPESDTDKSRVSTQIPAGSAELFRINRDHRSSHARDRQEQ